MAALLASAALTLPNGGPALGATGGGGFSFTNFELAATPPRPTGTVCPNTVGNCWNFAAEPAIRADGAGNFYASSENGLGGGTDAWKSSDGGRHYATLDCPNCLSNANNTGFAPGGGDTDLATAPVRNTGGFYNVYVASLTLGNIDVSTSTDGGSSWLLNATSATIGGDDREWIAADGASKVCISYHDVFTFNLDVNCSLNAGLTFTQLGSAIDASHLFLLQNNGSGNLAIDPSNHVIYQVFDGIHDAGDLVCNQTADCMHTVWIAVSTDGGRTFTDHVVYNNPVQTANYNHQFVNVSIDKAGNVYAVFTDNHNVFYSFSTNHGTTWSGPFQVNKIPANTAIFPWSAAGNSGQIDIVYYGTSYFNASLTPDNYPSSAAWYVYFAQNLDALEQHTFSQAQASPIIHFGGVCESGVTCTGNRDLFDDFGVSASPITGLASIIYSDDQYTNDANNPPQPGCDPGHSNTRNCDHTSIATQTAGPGIRGGGGGACHEGDGQGDIQGKNAGTAHFQSDEDSCEDGDQNSEQIKDSGAGEDFRSTTVQSVQFDSALGTMTVYGLGVSNGVPVAFVIIEQAPTATSNGFYSVELSDGYVNSGPLLSGAITL